MEASTSTTTTTTCTYPHPLTPTRILRTPFPLPASHTHALRLMRQSHMTASNQSTRAHPYTPISTPSSVTITTGFWVLSHTCKTSKSILKTAYTNTQSGKQTNGQKYAIITTLH